MLQQLDLRSSKVDDVYKDGDVISFFGAEESWSVVCNILGLEHLVNDPRYDTQEKRNNHSDELGAIFDDAFSKKSRAEWQSEFRKARLRLDPCLDYAELVTHPQIIANDLIVEIDHPLRGKTKMLNFPVSFKGTALDPSSYRHPPIVAEHSEEILREAGYSPQAIDEMVDMGVVRTATKWVRPKETDKE